MKSTIEYMKAVASTYKARRMSIDERQVYFDKLWMEAQEGNARSKKILFENLYGMLIKQAQIFSRDSNLNTLEDCLQQTFIGLEAAYRTYKPGLRLFSTHAHNHIRGTLLNFVKGNQVIKLPSKISLNDRIIKVSMSQPDLDFDFADDDRVEEYFVNPEYQTSKATKRYKVKGKQEVTQKVEQLTLALI